MNLSAEQRNFPAQEVGEIQMDGTKGKRGWFQAVQPFPKFFSLTV